MFASDTTISISGAAADTGGSGIAVVRLALRNTSTGQWYNFDNNSFNGATGNGATSANLSINSVSSADWGLAVNLAPNDYSIAVRTIDNAGNASAFISRPFSVIPADNQTPSTVITTPAAGSSFNPGNLTIEGTASDTGGSGIAVVRLALRNNSTGQWYNFDNNSFNGATGNGATSASLSINGASSADWDLSVTLPSGDYSVAVRTIDNAGNASAFISRPFSVVAP